MRVLHVISRMNQGGTATYLGNLISGLNKAGVENLLVHGEVTDDEVESEVARGMSRIQFSHLSRKLSIVGDLKSVTELNKVVTNFKPNVLHSHAFKGGLISRMARGVGFKRVHTFHGHHLYDPEFGSIERFAMNRIESMLSRRTDGIVTVGRKVGLELQDAGAIRGSFDSIPPGVNRPYLLDKDECRAALGIPKFATHVVGWMGRFVEVKRPEILVGLAKRHPNLAFVAAGSGPLLEKINSLKLPNLILPGWQDSNLILSACDIFISTSQSEGMPLALIEAQRCGIPTIAPDVGSVAEIIKHKQTGYITRMDLSDMEDYLNFLTSDENERIRLSKNASENSEKCFSIESMVNSHLSLYAKLL
jgi:glycosyltransferase involved in cell wall biosynthesis